MSHGLVHASNAVYDGVCRPVSLIAVYAEFAGYVGVGRAKTFF